MPPLEGDEQVKEGTGLKILTPNKVLTRLSMLLAQKKLETVRTKSKMKSEKCCIFCISII